MITTSPRGFHPPSKGLLSNKNITAIIKPPRQIPRVSSILNRPYIAPQALFCQILVLKRHHPISTLKLRGYYIAYLRAERTEESGQAFNSLLCACVLSSAILVLQGFSNPETQINQSLMNLSHSSLTEQSSELYFIIIIKKQYKWTINRLPSPNRKLVSRLIN